jgi:hypothetical protein
MDDEIAKHLPKLDEYDLEWVRNSLNVKGIEINRWKSIVVELLDRVVACEKSLHVAMVNRQKDMIKLGELSIERDELRKTNEKLLERMSACEVRLDKASDVVRGLRKEKEVAA